MSMSTPDDDATPEEIGAVADDFIAYLNAILDQAVFVGIFHVNCRCALPPDGPITVPWDLPWLLDMAFDCTTPALPDYEP